MIQRLKKTKALGQQILMVFLLCGVVIAAYWQVPGYDFVFDDSAYVQQNDMVGKGVTIEGAVWAFTTFHAMNWHPLAWLSHMLDVQCFGVNARAHHLVNLLLHLLNTCLLLVVLARMTGALWRSGLVAAWFAVHPLHVENVAWIAERKDLLCTLFWFLATGAYLAYLRRRSVRNYLAVLLVYALGLLSKPMLVTFPFFLLLVDFWPLSRKLTGRVFLEKVPLVFMAGGAAVLTVLAQAQGQTIQSLAAFPVWVRIANALVSLGKYIGKAVWPSPLGLLYTYPQPALLPWLGFAAGVLVVFVTVVVVRMARSRPYLVTGWFWYLGTLVPVIGIVQVSVQAMADRYAYVPLVGIFIMTAWGVPELPGLRSFRKTLAAAAALSVLLLLPVTVQQSRYWRNDIALFQRAVQVNFDSTPAHHLLGFALAMEGRSWEARMHLSGALTDTPAFENAQVKRGVELLGQPGKVPEAVRCFRYALGVHPNSPQAHANLGLALALQGKTAEGVDHLREAIKIAPQLAEPHLVLGEISQRDGRLAEAAVQYREALRLRPDYAAARLRLEQVAGSDHGAAPPSPGR